MQEILNKTFFIEYDCLANGAKQVDIHQFVAAVDLLANASRIASSGCGHSGIACRHFAHLMCCIERPARFISPSDAVHGATGYLQEDDVVVLVSRGGKTSELIPILEISNKKNVKIILLTENKESILAEKADVVLQIYVTEETDKFNSQGTTSFTATCVIFHALQAALIEKIDFKLDNFAQIHPGGAVGERLNKKTDI